MFYLILLLFLSCTEENNSLVSNIFVSTPEHGDSMTVDVKRYIYPNVSNVETGSKTNGKVVLKDTEGNILDSGKSVIIKKSGRFIVEYEEDEVTEKKEFIVKIKVKEEE